MLTLYFRIANYLADILSSRKNVKNLKMGSFRIFKISKNQILNTRIVKEKKGKHA